MVKDVFDRRFVLKYISWATSAAAMPRALLGADAMEEVFPYGIIGQMKVAAGKRSALIEIMAIGMRDMPGSISYTISEDHADENAIWITEYWETKEAHAASLQLPSVQAAIAKGRPMIEGFGHRFEVTPKAGK